ncbi:MAG: VTT domain-containing protein [Anaerolineae bacterium]|nr:VTT domain-containing protein [Anaerolineae bacterium]
MNVSPLPTAQSDNPPKNSQDIQRFGLKHVGALLLAIAIPILIYIFRDQVRHFDKLGYMGAFLAMLISNATVILPVPGLFIVFVLGHTYHPLLLGLVVGPGAALGELVAYFAGFSSSGVIRNAKIYKRMEQRVKRYGPAAIAVLAIIPNPAFDIAGVVSGALGIRWWQFLLAAWIGKTIQAIMIAYAGSLSVGWVERLLR